MNDALRKRIEDLVWLYDERDGSTRYCGGRTVEARHRDVVDALRVAVDGLEALSLPSTRADYDVAKLDAVVMEQARTTLTELSRILGVETETFNSK